MLFARRLLTLHTANTSHAPVAELVDAPDLGSGNFGCVGSSPIRCTSQHSRNSRKRRRNVFYCASPNDTKSSRIRPHKAPFSKTKAFAFTSMRREFFFCAQKIFALCAHNFSSMRKEFSRYTHAAFLQCGHKKQECLSCVFDISGSLCVLSEIETKAQKTKPLQLSLQRFAVCTRLELVTPCVTGMYSNQLN